MKTTLLSIYFIFMLCTFFVWDIKKYIYLTIFFIFFPIIITVMGRDAISTGTICIFLLYLKYFINSRHLLNESYDKWIYLLVLLGTASIIVPFLTGAMDSSQYGPAIRHYIGFLGAVLFFIVIKNHESNSPESVKIMPQKAFETLITATVVLVGVHILISIGVKYFPSLGSALKPFLSRGVTTFDIFGRGNIERLGTFVFSYESTAEILATLTPLILYKLFMHRPNPYFWFGMYLLFGLGVVLTTTRSGVLLFSFGSFISIIFHFQRNFGKIYALGFVFTSSLFLAVIIQPAFFKGLEYRFQDAANIYSSGGSIFEIINRDRVFKNGWDVTVRDISLFGNGISEFNFHNLFLTIIYQMGIVGGFVYLGVLAYPVILLIRNYPRKYSINDQSLFFSCLLSILLFFMNELKYEFNRTDSYQQMCWGLFAIYYLIASQQYNAPER